MSRLITNPDNSGIDLLEPFEKKVDENNLSSLDSIEKSNIAKNPKTKINKTIHLDTSD